MHARGGDGNTITKGYLYSCQAICCAHDTLTSAYIVCEYAMEMLSVCVCLELLEHSSTVGMV